MSFDLSSQEGLFGFDSNYLSVILLPKTVDIHPFLMAFFYYTCAVKIKNYICREYLLLSKNIFLNLLICWSIEND